MNKQTLAKQLVTHLKQIYRDRTGISLASLEEINMGWETELYTFEVDSRKNGDRIKEHRVLRVFQGDGAGRKSAKEYFLMSRLCEAGYPVPRVYSHEASGETIGKPFILMERILGNTLDATYRNETPEELQRGIYRLIKLFVKLHQLDVTSFKDVPNLPFHDDHVQDTLDWYGRNAQEQLYWLKPVVDWLTERKQHIDMVPPSLLHMDFHGMNVMLRGDGSEAVIDWSLSRIGDHRMDLGWTMLLYTTFGEEVFRGPILAEYSEQSGEEVADLEFFEVIAATRRIIDFALTVGGDIDSIGLKPEVVEMMKESKEHFQRVHDVLTERTGITLDEFVEALDSF
jgi:aminoglycoside phosphotransferase (APT) family kinase protein